MRCAQVHLVAVPDTGAVFVGWAGACSGTGGCDLTLDAHRDDADGTGFHAVDTSNDGGWLGLRVDDVALYYWHSGAVIRRLK